MSLMNRRSASEPKLSPEGMIRSRKGMTLLELLIALLVLQIALVTFAQFITKALDYSRRIRQVEMAHILAQAKMEELTRTISAAGAPIPLGRGKGPVLLNERPGGFRDLAYSRSEDVAPFRWLAEATPSATNPKLLELTLRIYVIDRRARLEDVSEPVDIFDVSEGMERFNYTYMLPDGAAEAISAKEKLRVTSAVAIP